MAAAPAIARAGEGGIVSLDYGLASTMLALGGVPRAIASLRNWSEWVVEPAMPPGVVDIGTTSEINLEVLTSIRPSLILSTPFLAALEEKLARIAPVEIFTVYAENGEALDRSYAETLRLGAMIGRQRQANAFLSRADATFRRLRERVTSLSAPPIAVINFMDQRHARIYGGPGLYGGAMRRIGLENAWKGEASYWGFQTIGLEQLAELNEETHLVVVSPLFPPDVLTRLSDSPLWTSLPFVRRQRISVVPGVLMFGMVQEALRFSTLMVDVLETAAR
ncbi:iron-siderophore ABC transporter substrate-binding protein [Rhizobium binae]|uniref:Iron complex transport system substrate-binding protein n=1 Tax=Rhizobium binae TaxID=1138190 RepID=A0ABV2MPE1_9HYPH|nr:iron-siderophore ABC transporter substrate-binding protein [Rhizobium binae]NKL50949.1 ABC transporter substrate-binding protein [Rhizobium leguminosarum bv. viciae]MBX4926237.1 iron-siderophore ABC transporter substrate-binding protein [Rhizobium binae]MBX4936384.1 iron-siderophore ABC transporter substrate-binding protein [Rhizobium binae]MBX4942707.1 iron-siderophore ABC transporter substrate-binding protein [Rhizobium binae]MBX4949699.1 iron-siderophore ABC transporter substrate-binding